MLITIVYTELFCYHGGNHCLSQTDHVSQEETIIFQKFLISFYDSIRLIFIARITFRHIKRILSIDSKHTVCKILHEHLNVKFVWRNVSSKISSHDRTILNIISQNRTVFCLLPKLLKLVASEFHIFIISKFHIKLILTILTNP